MQQRPVGEAVSQWAAGDLDLESSARIFTGLGASMSSSTSCFVSPKHGQSGAAASLGYTGFTKSAASTKDSIASKYATSQLGVMQNRDDAVSLFRVSSGTWCST